jgi:uncharacterized phage protein gp47/JayE
MSVTIDDTGFHRDRLDQIVADLTASFQSIYGSDIDVSPDSPDGQLIGILAEMVSDAQQMAESVYNALAPAGATGAALARLALLNGVIRKPAQFSTSSVSLTGTPGTVVPAGSLIGSSDVNNPATFATDSTLTIGSTGVVIGTATATTPGPINAAAGTLTKVQTVINGWVAVTNTSAASPGTLAETDPALRVRRAQSVALPSQGITDGMFAALLQVANVTAVAVYENFLDTPISMHGGGTLAPHAIQAIVEGGDPIDIATTIWNEKSQGVTLVGAQTQAITDSQGTSQTIRFDRPTEADIFVTVQLTQAVGSATKTAIINAIVAFGQANAAIGKDIIWSQLFIPINSIPGLSVNSVFLGLAASPTAQVNLTIPFNALPTWNAANIVVTP